MDANLDQGEKSIVAGLMTAAEACEFFRIGKTTLYEWTNRGLLQSTKIAGSRRWLRRSILDCAARHIDQTPIHQVRK